MKILFVLDRPNLYGSEKHLLKLMRIFKKEDEVTLLAFNNGPLLDLLKDEQIKHEVINIKWYPTGNLWRFAKFIRNNQFDIIHAHQPKALFWSAVIGKLLAIPTIVTIHSLPSSNIQSYNQFIKKVLVGAFHYSVKFFAELLAERVIYLSNFSYNTALNKKKSIIIPNWVDDIKSDNSIKPIFNTKISFISVGSVSYNKGVDRLLVALSLIKHESWNIRFVGDCTPAYKQQLQKSALLLDIADRIEFVGYSSKIDEMMLESDGFILLSRGETFGMVYIEAMNCGLPVIAWNIPVLKELLPEGNVVMSDNDDIKRVFPEIYSSQQSYQELSLKNRNFVKNNFSLDKIYFKYRNLYDKILSSNRS